jgi:tetratricopeptide (TPR) repeat protein
METMMRMAFTLVMILCSAAWGDVIHLKDGRVLRGTVQRGPEGYVVTTEDGKRETIPVDRVKLLEATNDPAGADRAMQGLESLRRAVLNLDDIDQILERFRRFVDQNPDTPAAREAMRDIQQWEERKAQGLVKFAGQWVTQRIREQSRRQSLDNAQQALQLLKQGRMTEADPLLRQALDEDPQNVTAMYLRAYLLAEQDQLVAAKKLLEETLALVPDHVPTLNNLAVVLWRQKQPAAAMVRYDRAMMVSPGNKQVLNNVAEALHALPEDARRGTAAQKARQRFESQDAQLQAELEPTGWYRWGSTWVNRDQLNQLREAERQIQDRLDALSAQFDDTQAAIRRIESDMEGNARSMRQIEASSYIRDWDGNFIAVPYPPLYYDLQRDNANLVRQREAEVMKLQSLRQAANEVRKQLPVPRYTGAQRPFGPEGAPLMMMPTTVPTTTQRTPSAAG